MPYHVDDTIAAIASAPGGAARGILRISGPSVVAILLKCFRSADFNWPHARLARVTGGQFLAKPPLGDIPCDLYLWPTDRSYTRQPSAEIHTFGSPPLLEAILRGVCEAGARLAEPGEFTLRAFLAGRLDLTQAEAVLGVIDAGSRAELNVALAQLAGGLASPLNGLRDQLLDLLAHLEAGLDFVEEDIQFITPQQLDRQLGQSAALVTQIAEQMTSRGETAHEFRVVLVGWPNVGKSSLFNSLAGDPAALVSDLAGTTRDYVSRRVVIEGLSCLLIDTAGVEAATSIDGMRAAVQAITAKQSEQAHLRLFCLDATRPLNDWERRQIALPHTARLLVLTKTDATKATDLQFPAIETSSRIGLGLDELRRAIAGQITALASHESSIVSATAARCRESLRQAASSLQRARETAALEWGEELVAADVRNALDELGKVVGAVYTDDVLDRIFSRFCIGK
jgi:tRNA modification GTPase